MSSFGFGGHGQQPGSFGFKRSLDNRGDRRPFNRGRGRGGRPQHHNGGMHGGHHGHGSPGGLAAMVDNPWAALEERLGIPSEIVPIQLMGAGGYMPYAGASGHVAGGAGAAASTAEEDGHHDDQDEDGHDDDQDEGQEGPHHGGAAPAEGNEEDVDEEQHGLPPDAGAGSAGAGPG